MYKVDAVKGAVWSSRTSTILAKCAEIFQTLNVCDETNLVTWHHVAVGREQERGLLLRVMLKTAYMSMHIIIPLCTFLQSALSEDEGAYYESVRQHRS